MSATKAGTVTPQSFQENVMRLRSVFVSCAMMACSVTPMLSQVPVAPIDGRACVESYLDLTNAAFDLYWYVGDPNKHLLHELASAAGDAADLAGRNASAAQLLCAAERIAVVNALQLRLKAWHSRVVAAEAKRHINDVEEAITKVLAAAPPDPPPEN